MVFEKVLYHSVCILHRQVTSGKNTSSITYGDRRCILPRCHLPVENADTMIEHFFKNHRLQRRRRHFKSDQATANKRPRVTRVCARGGVGGEGLQQAMCGSKIYQNAWVLMQSGRAAPGS